MMGESGTTSRRELVWTSTSVLVGSNRLDILAEHSRSHRLTRNHVVHGFTLPILNFSELSNRYKQIIRDSTGASYRPGGRAIIFHSMPSRSLVSMLALPVLCVLCPLLPLHERVKRSLFPASIHIFTVPTGSCQLVRQTCPTMIRKQTGGWDLKIDLIVVVV